MILRVFYRRIVRLLMTAGTIAMYAVTTGKPACGLETASFQSAKPVWPEGRDREKNLTVGFRAAFPQSDARNIMLRVAGSTIYRIYLNGRFVGHGPARGPHGFYRVDEWNLSGLATAPQNLLAIEVAGYNVNSYYLLDQPSFLQAEIIADGKVVASTGGGGTPFDACIPGRRLQKVQRFSFQRPFIEYYRLGEGYNRWLTDVSAPVERVACAVLPAKNLIPRRVSYPRFRLRQPSQYVSQGQLERDVPVEKLRKDRALTDISTKLKGYEESELEIIPSIELQKIRTVSMRQIDDSYNPDTPVRLGDNSCAIFDFGTNLTGFIGMRIGCAKAAKLYVTFDEILSDGDVDFKRLGCVNAIGYELEPGLYSLESFEPYTFRYLKLNVVSGSCEAGGLYLRELANPESDGAFFACSDPRLNTIFEAARETFRQNAVDIFMDCPSRERAGWLCDSFFTSRVAFDLCGNATIEKNFYENFLLPKSFEYMPDGMLPMCYPADHNDGVFIPNWALWFVVELEEYQARSGDRELVDALKPKVLALFDYFTRFRNGDGLLENLENWIFVEWSAANQFVRDVNYPSNMLYAAALSAAGRMYDMPGLASQAEQIREVIRRQSFDGRFFVDNAVRKDGKLAVTGNRTEVCQYYAFFFDVAAPEKNEGLWRMLTTEFGPDRAKKGAYPDIHPANAFIGNYLRIELLSRYGLCGQEKDELAGYFLYMAEKTGTLWENIGTTASCNHGFASHVSHCLYRDILGVYRIDTQNKRVNLRFCDTGLEWCEGRMPVPGGDVNVSWAKEGESIRYSIDVPAGYTVTVENLSGKTLVRR
ncbi:hypothetical protein LLG96_10165 [bacterium]|nr:hypothetical protein [bacterium]